MSFGRAFDAFVGGLESGLKSGNDLQDRQLRRRPAKEAADLDRSVPGPGMARVQGIEGMKARVQSNSGDEAIPTQGTDDLGGFYAEGGEVTDNVGVTDTSKWGTFTPNTPAQAPAQTGTRLRDRPGMWGDFARSIDASKEQWNTLLTPWDYFMGGRLKPALRQFGQMMNYADGGYVDPVEQDNGSYYREEAARQQGAIPTGAVSAPTPPPRPAPAGSEMAGNTADLDKDGNIIQKTVRWVENLPPLPGAGAIGDPSQPPQGPVHPIQQMVDLSGKSYPDLTTFIGGVRQVTGAPANKPLTTADHIDFLQRRFQYAAQHGYDLNEALKFNVQYLDNLRFQAGRTFALAGAAWDANDGEAVQKFVQQGYGLLPDGLSAKTSFKDGVLHVQPIDERTNKPTGSPMTLTKDQFLQKARSITGDPVSWGQALENVPYTAGTTRAAGRSRGYGRRAEAGDTGAAPKPMSAKAQEMFDKKFTTVGDRQVATVLQGALDPDKRSMNHIERAISLMKGGANPEDGPEGYGIYQNGKLAYRLDQKAMPGPKPANKMTPDAPTAPTTPAKTEPAKGIGATKPGPGAKPEQPAGTAAADTPKPKPAEGAIPTGQEPSMWEKFQKTGKELGNKVVKPAIGIPSREEQGSTNPSEAGDGQAAQKARVADLEKKLADAEKRGVPEASLKIMRARLEQERAGLN